MAYFLMGIRVFTYILPFILSVLKFCWYKKQIKNCKCFMGILLIYNFSASNIFPSSA